MITRSQALPGNAYPEALPPNFLLEKRGRASRHRFPGRAWERVEITLLTEDFTVKIHKDIATFLYWLKEEPSLFLPEAWRDLPNLEDEIANLADNESSIAEAIKNWCIERDLGEQLRDCLRKDFDDAGEPTPSTTPPLTNITQTLRTSIEDSYKKLHEIAANNQSNTSNDSN
jgi:hypothetical protein